MPSDMDLLRGSDPEVAALIEAEELRQQRGLELIPSENYTWPEVLTALGSLFTNKYSEGYPGRRYYGGQEHTDALERLAVDRACALFGAEHANVQALSGSPMNQAVYLGLLDPGDTILAMDLSHGGHLTHGSPVSHMGRIFRFVRYKTLPEEGGRVDFDALLELAHRVRPQLVLCGTTSHPRRDDYAAYARVAREVGAFSMADVSHVGGLIAGGALPSPFEGGIDVVTTTSHKSLRGPRGGLILCREELASRIDRSVFPGLQGGPHMNTVAALSVALRKAQQPDFRRYARQVLDNAQVLAGALSEAGVQLVTGGTDTHLIVIDAVASFGIDGRALEHALDQVGLATNKQVVPDDPRPPLRPSGLRIGTPAATTRGMGADEMGCIAHWIAAVGRAPDDRARLRRVASEVETLCRAWPVPGAARLASAAA